MKGISLIEILIAIAIISALSVIGTNNFLNIKNDAEIDAQAEGLISDIKLARSKSMNGELIQGEDESDFAEDGLPKYGISFDSDSYKIVRNCLKSDGVTTCEATDNLEVIQYTEDFKERKLGDRFVLDPSSGDFFFTRITGETSSITITVKEKNDKFKREINIADSFVINISE